MFSLEICGNEGCGCYCTVLYCIILYYCTVLFCIDLYYSTVLYCIVLYYRPVLRLYILTVLLKATHIIEPLGELCLKSSSCKLTADCLLVVYLLGCHNLMQLVSHIICHWNYSRQWNFVTSSSTVQYNTVQYSTVMCLPMEYVCLPERHVCLPDRHVWLPERHVCLPKNHLCHPQWHFHCHNIYSHCCHTNYNYTLLRGGVTLKKWKKLGQRGGGSDPNPIFFLHNFLFLETTNLPSPYLKTCVTVKIWLNLMHINLISRQIHATVPVPGGGEWVVFGEICLPKMFRLWF